MTKEKFKPKEIEDEIQDLGKKLIHQLEGNRSDLGITTLCFVLSAIIRQTENPKEIYFEVFDFLEKEFEKLIPVGKK